MWAALGGLRVLWFESRSHNADLSWIINGHFCDELSLLHKATEGNSGREKSVDWCLIWRIHSPFFTFCHTFLTHTHTRARARTYVRTSCVHLCFVGSLVWCRCWFQILKFIARRRKIDLSTIYKWTDQYTQIIHDKTAGSEWLVGLWKNSFLGQLFAFWSFKSFSSGNELQDSKENSAHTIPDGRCGGNALCGFFHTCGLPNLLSFKLDNKNHV